MWVLSTTPCNGFYANLLGYQRSHYELKATSSIKLSRQVGHRYFVPSKNAGRILCPARWATQFLEALQVTKELNNLERDVSSYGLIVYADLMI